MRELETSLQEFGEFVLKAQLVKEKAAPYCVRWVRRFLTRQASDQSLTDQVRTFCEELEQHGACQEWQVHQAEQALRIYFVNFLGKTDWDRQPGTTVVDVPWTRECRDHDDLHARGQGASQSGAESS